MKTDGIIPRKVLFDNPDKTNVQVSKDGKYISYLKSSNGVSNIFIAENHNIHNSKIITNDQNRGIKHYFWAYNNKHIIYLQDNKGDENFYLNIVNINNLQNTIIKTDADVKTQIVKTSYKNPNEIVIGLNDRRKDLFDLYKLNIITSKKILLYLNNKFTQFYLDDNYNIIFSCFIDEHGDAKLFYKKKIYVNIPHIDSKTTTIIGMNHTNSKAYFLDSRNRDKASLFLIDIQNKTQKLLFKPKEADIDNIILHPRNKCLQAVCVNYTQNKYYTLFNNQKPDKYFIEDLKKLEKKFTNSNVEIASRSLDDNKWIIIIKYDDRPSQYYIFIRKIKKLQFLFCNRNDLSKYQLNKMKPIIIKSRDGLPLVSYLTRPNSELEKPTPMVLYVHGGPNARDYWGFNLIHQWLSNRGYAVLSINYRGSTGFGKNFINAGNGEWAGKMHNDLIDGVNWAINNNITDKNQIAIMGGSYGGYATLVGLTFTPNTFACGIDIVGPSNLITLIESIPQYWKPFLKDLIIKTGGDPNTITGKNFLKEKSPLFFVNKITKPLLICQGANDPRVKQLESDQIVYSMRKKNIPVIYALYSDEGHGLQRPENRLSFFTIVEKFLSQHLKGKYETKHYHLSRSSLKIVEGKKHLKY